MFARKVRSVFITATLIFTIIILVFAGGLNIGLFKKTYTNSILSSYTVIGGETVRKIEYAVKYGKKLNNFFGMSAILEEVKRSSPDIEDVLVTLPDGTIAYKLGAQPANGALPANLAEQVNFDKADGQTYLAILHDGRYHTILPIRDRQNKWIGSMDITFGESVINARSDSYLQQIALYLLFLAALSVVFLALMLYKIEVLDEAGKIRKKAILWVILPVVGASQLLYGIINLTTFQSTYLDVSRENTSLAAKIIHKDISSVVEKGVNYSELYQTKDWMNRIIKYVPEIQEIEIVTQKEQASSGVGTKTTADADYFYSLPLMKDAQGVGASVNVVISHSYINARLRDMAFDSATVLIISFLMLSELTSFLVLMLQKQPSAAVEMPGDKPAYSVSAVRFLGFLFTVGAAMSISFIPLMAQSLYRSSLPVPVNLAAGLPVSFELVGVALAITVGRPLMVRKGRWVSLTAGIALLGLALLISSQAWSLISLLVFRSFAGFGLGLCLIALRSLAFHPMFDKKQRSELYRGFSHGSYIGFCCGSVLGALLADWIGFAGAFYVAFFMVAAAGIFAFFVVGAADLSQAEDSYATIQPTVTDMSAYMSNGHGFSLAAFAILPMALFSAFIIYLFPLYVQSKGVTMVGISRAFLLYGLCLVYFRPWMTKRFVAAKSRKYTTIAVFAAVAGWLAFAYGRSVLMAFVAVVLFGLGGSIWALVKDSLFINYDPPALPEVAAGAEPAGFPVLEDEPKNPETTDDEAPRFDELAAAPADDLLIIVTALGAALGAAVLGVVAMTGKIGMMVLGAVGLLLVGLFLLNSQKDEGEQVHVTGV